MYLILACFVILTNHVASTSTEEPVGSGPPGRAMLHYNQKSFDPRPRVVVRFAGDGQPKLFSLLLDSGSNLNYVFALEGWMKFYASRAPKEMAAVSDGYLHTGEAPLTDGPRLLMFGTAQRPWSVLCSGQVDENVILYSSAREDKPALEFRARFDLSRAIANPQNGSGTLGAAKSSDFARAAGVFAYMPSRKRYSPLNPVYAGQLIFREDRISAMAESNCVGGSSGLKFFDTVGGREETHWLVAGSSRAGNLGRAYEMTWAIDTGAPGTLIPQSTYDDLIALISATGARPITNSVQIENCPGDYKDVFPNLSFTIGSMDIKLAPADYIVDYINESRICLMLVFAGHRKHGPNGGILGTGVLAKMFTVLDKTNDRIGVCPLTPSPPAFHQIRF